MAQVRRKKLTLLQRSEAQSSIDLFPKHSAAQAAALSASTNSSLQTPWCWDGSLVMHADPQLSRASCSQAAELATCCRGGSDLGPGATKLSPTSTSLKESQHVVALARTHRWGYHLVLTHTAVI